MTRAVDTEEDRGLLRPLVGDGVALLLIAAAGLTAAGLFLILVGATGQFLPHDVGYLGWSFPCGAARPGRGGCSRSAARSGSSASSPT